MASMSIILESFPYPSIRDVQLELLTRVEQAYEEGYEVVVVVAPTASGKSAIARTLLSHYHNAAYIVPTNQLLKQFTDEFPETKAMHRVDSYRCKEFPGWSCDSRRRKGALKKFCKGCPCALDIAHAKFRKGPVACNYYTLMSHKITRDLLVVDEAHNLIPTIAELGKVRYWYHKLRDMPAGTDHSVLRAWFDKLPQHKKEGKRIQALAHTLTSDYPQYVLKEDTDDYAGGGLTDVEGDPIPRGVATLAPCLDLLPIDVRDLPATGWLLGGARRLLLLSATISVIDIADLGLDRRRVLYLECESPIPADRRPIFYEPVAVVGHKNLEHATRQIARHIEEHLLPQYEGKKGLIHATYEQARILRGQLRDPKFLFHTSDPANKAAVYAKFRAAKPETGVVLVASGMEEGIDLAGDAAGWQVLAKIPWIDLTDPAIAHKKAVDPSWYTWQVWRKVLQASGRVCRGPEDEGDTHIADGSFSRLLEDAPHQIPRWWRVALDEGDRILHSGSGAELEPEGTTA